MDNDQDALLARSPQSTSIFKTCCAASLPVKNQAALYIFHGENAETQAVSVGNRADDEGAVYCTYYASQTPATTVVLA